MKKLLALLPLFLLGASLHAQLVATMQIKEHIPGICDEGAVYALFPSMKGQVEAVCPLTKEELLAKLNSDVAFLKDKPKYKDKGMLNIIISCKGKMVSCKMDTKTKSTELDDQIVAVFNKLLEWKPGTLNGQEVDTSLLYSFKIKNGKITFD